MKWTMRGVFSAAMLAAVSQMTLAQVTLIEDAFSTDSSADYTVVNGGVSGGGDGSVTWAFDYGSYDCGMNDPCSIPPAPGTTDGSTRGVRVTVNETSNNGGVDETEAYTIFHNTEIVGVQDYTMTIDVWMGVWAPGDTGSTESAQIGVAGDGVTRNHLFEVTSNGLAPFSGSGHFIAVSGDGGDSSDYRHWKSGAPVNQFSPDYLSPDMGTNVTSANFIGFFENISNTLAPIPGVIGNNWATIKVELLQSEGKIKYYVRGGSAETTGDPFGPLEDPQFLQVVESDIVDAEGFVNFGLADMYASVATIAEQQFAIFDNLLVTGTGGGGVDCDFDDSGTCDITDIDALVAEVVAGTNNPAFDLNADSLVNDADVEQWLNDAGSYLAGDANIDGNVDGADFLTWNTNKFGGGPGGAWSRGDFTADGTVDGSDFLLWNANKFSSSDGVSVPEPASICLMIVGLLGLIRRRR